MSYRIDHGRCCAGESCSEISSYGAAVSFGTTPNSQQQHAVDAPTLGPKFVNDVGILGACTVNMFQGHLRQLSSHEIPTLSNFNGLYSVQEFCKWWIWGSAHGPHGPCPPPRAVIRWKGSRSGLTGTGNRAHRDNISKMCLLFDVIHNCAKRQLSGTYIQKLELAWTGMDSERGQFTLPKFVREKLVGTPEWQNVLTGHRLAKGEKRDGPAGVGDGDEASQRGCVGSKRARSMLEPDV